MALATKYNDYLPAVSLSLVKDSTNNQGDTIDTSGSDNQVTYAAMCASIYQLMSQIGINQAVVAQANAQSQVNQSDIMKVQAQNAQNISQDVCKKVDDYMHQLEEAAKWSWLGSIFKWIVAAIVIVIGALTSEFGVGLVLLTAVTIFMASPLFDMTVNAIADGLKAAGVSSSWANIIAQAIVIVVVTVCTFGIGGVAEGATMAARGAGEGVSVASTAAVSAVKMAIQALIQAILSSSLISSLLSQIPGSDTNTALRVFLSVLTVVISIAAALLAGKLMVNAAANDSTSLLNVISKNVPNAIQKLLPEIEALEYAVLTAGRVSRVVGTATQTGTGIGSGVYTVESGNTLGRLAPIQALLQFFNGLMKVMEQMSTQTQATTESEMKTYQTLFTTKFYADLQAVNAYLA